MAEVVQSLFRFLKGHCCKGIVSIKSYLEPYFMVAESFNIGRIETIKRVTIKEPSPFRNLLSVNEPLMIPLPSVHLKSSYDRK